jgi:hypothetical protein
MSIPWPWAVVIALEMIASRESVTLVYFLHRELIYCVWGDEVSANGARRGRAGLEKMRVQQDPDFCLRGTLVDVLVEAGQARNGHHLIGIDRGLLIESRIVCGACVIAELIAIILGIEQYGTTLFQEPAAERAFRLDLERQPASVAGCWKPSMHALRTMGKPKSFPPTLSVTSPVPSLG